MRIIKFILDWISVELANSREYNLNKKRCANCDHLRDLLREERFERDKLINKLVEKEVIVKSNEDEEDEDWKPINNISARTKRARKTFESHQKHLKNLEEEFKKEETNV